MLRFSDIVKLSYWSTRSLVLKRRSPILGTIVPTDICNLKCKHCAVNNIQRIHYPYEDIVREMRYFFEKGVRLLFFSGGETMLWTDGGKTIRDLIINAKNMGFTMVNIVTNGTVPLDIPEADMIFLSLDGTRDTHNSIRGDTYDTIMRNIEHSPNPNVCLYMAINNINYREIVDVARLARDHPKIRAISFNFHMPYKGTEDLCLTNGEKLTAVNQIKSLMRQGYPVFNLYPALDYYLKNNWKRPSYQCIVSEDGRRYVCGRCLEMEGLCENCGYLFVVELCLLFSGNPRVIAHMLKLVFKYIYAPALH